MLLIQASEMDSEPSQVYYVNDLKFILKLMWWGRFL